MAFLTVCAPFAAAWPARAQNIEFPSTSSVTPTFPQTQAAEPAPQRAAPAPVKPKPQPAAADNRVNPAKKREGAQGSQEAKLDAQEAKEMYLRRKRRLEQIRAQQDEVTRERRTLATSRARMQAQLVETARSLRLSERRLVEIDERLAVTRKNAQEQRAKLEDKTQQMSALFAVMQGMSRQPPPALVTHSKDALAMIRGGMVMANFYGSIEKIASQISADLADLESIQRETEIQEQRRKAEQAQSMRLKEQLDLLLIENREQIQAAQENLDGLQRAAQMHIASLKTLEDAVPKIDEEIAKVSTLGSYVQDLKAGGSSLSPDAAKVALAQPGRMKPSIPFSKAQGLLPMPVQGRIILRFGQERDGVPSPGMYIETRGSAQVVSPCDGWITYAGPLRTGGQLLIINTGDGYHIYMAGMERTHVTLGQFVLAGEPVGVMGAVEQRSGEKTSAYPALFLEFKKEKQSIDPSPWWTAMAAKG
jgi:septal ring factor EnvC (AmiA/AmiB activator)